MMQGRFCVLQWYVVGSDDSGHCNDAERIIYKIYMIS